MRIKVMLTIGYTSDYKIGEIEIPDGLTDTEIMYEVLEWVNQEVEYRYEKVED